MEFGLEFDIFCSDCFEVRNLWWDFSRASELPVCKCDMLCSQTGESLLQLSCHILNLVVMKRRINKDGKAERDCFQRRVIKVFLTACHFVLCIGRASRLIHNMVNPLHSCDTKIIPLSPSCLQGLYSTAYVALDLLFDLLIDSASIWQQRALHAAAMITRTNFLLFLFYCF